MGRRERVFLPEMDATLRRHYFLSDILRWLFLRERGVDAGSQSAFSGFLPKEEGGD